MESNYTDTRWVHTHRRNSTRSTGSDASKVIPHIQEWLEKYSLSSEWSALRRQWFEIVAYSHGVVVVVDVVEGHVACSSSGKPNFLNIPCRNQIDTSHLKSTMHSLMSLIISRRKGIPLHHWLHMSHNNAPAISNFTITVVLDQNYLRLCAWYLKMHFMELCNNICPQV